MFRPKGGGVMPPPKYTTAWGCAKGLWNGEGDTLNRLLMCRWGDPPLVSEILHVFIAHDSTPFHLNFGGVPVAPARPCWFSQSINLKLSSREIIFEVYVITVPTGMISKRYGPTDRQTDRQTIYCGIIALCTASRGNNIDICFFSVISQQNSQYR